MNGMAVLVQKVENGERVDRITSRYLIGSVGRSRFIICGQCLKRSWNENDVLQRYCGNCKVFHDP